MTIAYVKGAMILAALAAGWAAVQAAWGRAFRSECRDEPDALAVRGGCGGCDRAESCERRGEP